VSFSQSSDDKGHFTILDVNPGSYGLSVTKKGFSVAKMQGLTVTVGTTTLRAH
jgi:hypothetical protein